MHILLPMDDGLTKPLGSEHTHDKDFSQIEEIQKNLFAILHTTEEQKNDRQIRFEDFIQFRKIQEEDFPIIAELYTYPNDWFIRAFHNTFDSDQERSGETIQRMLLESSSNEQKKRFFELFLMFFQKYGRVITNHLNRIMECKKEWKRGLEPKDE